MMLICSALLGLVAAAAPPPAARAQDAPDFAKGLEALEREFEDAMDAFDAAVVAAASDEERAKIQRDPAQDPRKRFVPRFQEFAKRAEGTESGARALMWILANVREPDSGILRGAVDDLVGGYIDSPFLADIAVTLRYGTWLVGFDHARSALEKIAKDSPHAGVRSGALLSLGAVLYGEGGTSKAEAAGVLRRVVEEFPDTPAADGARGCLFEIENLQIGMVAPDFEAIDEDEVRYKLSDYRGKVVVVDFWGFW